MENEKEKRPSKRITVWKIVLGLIIFVVLAVAYRISIILYFAEDSPNTESSSVKNPEATATQTTKSNKTPKGSSTPNQQSSAQNNKSQAPSKEPEARDDSLINFFIETAIKDYQDRSFFVTRWTSPNVSVGVGEGNLSETLSGCLSSFINDFNKESSSIKLFRDDRVDLGIPNIKIYYWDNAKFKQKAGNIDNGFTSWNHKDDKSLQRSMVFLSEDIMKLDDAVKCQVIRHEMMHAVGFWGHDQTYFESIMSLPKTRYIYPEEDKTLVRMLYNSGIPIGSDESAARSYLESHFNNW